MLLRKSRGPHAFGFFAQRSYPTFAATALGGLLVAASTGSASSHGCMPNHARPLVILKNMGPCSFDRQTMSFAGEPVEQAKCLMRGMDATRNLVPTLESLPPALVSRIGADTGLPARELLTTFLSKQDFEWDFAANLWLPLSRANDNDPNAPMARYFVIHDTSGPNYGHRSFPPDIDVNPKINNLVRFKCPDGWGKAHVIVDRMGGMLLDHDFSIPWRETKFERAANFAGALKGLFVHVEMIQPRRSAGGGRNDAQTPDPSFTTVQYERLALLYIIASVRAGHWLIPAFHAAIDGHIPNGHDDPLNFDIDSFAAALERVMARVYDQEAELNTAGNGSVGCSAQRGCPPEVLRPVTAGTSVAPQQQTEPQEVKLSSVPRWGVWLAADLSESGAWALYRARVRRFASLIGDRKPVVLLRPLPAMGKAKRYIIAIVDDDRAPLDKFCKKLTAAGNTCNVMRNEFGP